MFKKVITPAFKMQNTQCGAQKKVTLPTDKKPHPSFSSSSKHRHVRIVVPLEGTD
jgi:hypothetical protein